MRKKRISLLLVFAMLLSMLPVTAVAAPAANEPTASWTHHTVTLTAPKDTVGEQKDITGVRITNETSKDAYTITSDTGTVEVYKNSNDAEYIYLLGADAKFYDVKTDSSERALEMESFEADSNPAGLVSKNKVNIEADMTLTITGKPIVTSEKTVTVDAKGNVTAWSAEEGHKLSLYVVDDYDLTKVTQATKVGKDLTPISGTKINRADCVDKKVLAIESAEDQQKAARFYAAALSEMITDSTPAPTVTSFTVNNVTTTTPSEGNTYEVTLPDVDKAGDVPLTISYEISEDTTIEFTSGGATWNSEVEKFTATMNVNVNEGDSATQGFGFTLKKAGASNVTGLLNVTVKVKSGEDAKAPTLSTLKLGDNQDSILVDGQTEYSTTLNFDDSTDQVVSIAYEISNDVDVDEVDIKVEGATWNETDKVLNATVKPAKTETEATATTVKITLTNKKDESKKTKYTLSIKGTYTEQTGDTYTVTGTVYELDPDTKVKTPLADATITVETKAKADAIKTDANGEYTIEGLTGGDYTITAEKDGYGPATINVSVGGEEKIVTVEDIVLEKASEGDNFTLKLDLTNLTATDAEDGQELTKDQALTVTLTPNAGYKLPESVTVEMGGETLEDGTGYTYVKGVVTISTVTGSVTITAAGTEDSGNKADLGLTVTVGEETKTLAEDKDSMSVTLGDQKGETASVDFGYKLTGDTKVVSVTVKDADEAADGNGKVTVSVDGDPATVTFVVTDGTDTNTYTLVITATSKSTYSISGRVYDIADDTKAIAGATVTCGDKNGTTDADGKYTITGLVDSTYTLTAKADGYESKTIENVEVNGKNVENVDFALEATGDTPPSGDKPVLNKLTVGNKPMTIKPVMTVTLDQSNEKTYDVLITYDIADDVSIDMDIAKETAEGFVATVTPGELAEVVITLTKGDMTNEYTVVINVPRPTGSTAPVLTGKTELVEGKDAKDYPVTIESTVAFDKTNGKNIKNWEISGTNLKLSSIAISEDGKTATLTFSGTAAYSTMNIKALAAAFVEGTTDDSNTIEIKIDRDTSVGEYTTVVFTVIDDTVDPAVNVDGVNITVRDKDGTGIDGGKTKDGKLTLHLQLADEGKPYTVEASKNGYTVASADVTTDSSEVTLNIKKIETKVAAEVDASGNAPATELKLPDEDHPLAEGSDPVEATVNVDATEATVTFDENQVKAMKDKTLVSSTTVNVGKNSVTIPAEVLSEKVGASEIGVEVKETGTTTTNDKSGNPINVKKAVSVTVYDVTDGAKTEITTINGLVNQLITIIMDVGEEITDRSQFALIYIDNGVGKKISDSRWAPVEGTTTITVSMSHLSEIALISSDDAANLDADAAGQILIAGKVTDETGAPAEGVTVTLKGGEAELTATTNENGEYDFSENGTKPYADNVEYTLNFEKAGYYDSKTDVKLALTGGKMNVKLNRVMTDVTVTVVDENGNPVENATVTVTLDGQMLTFSLLTDKENEGKGIYGGVKLPAGEHDISVNAKQGDKTISGATKLILPGATNAMATLTEAGAEGTLQFRDAGKNGMIEVRFTGQAGTKYLVEAKSDDGKGNRDYRYNLYNGVVDTFMETRGQNRDTIKIWKILNSNDIIEFTRAGVASVRPAQVDGSFTTSYNVYGRDGAGNTWQDA